MYFHDADAYFQIALIVCIGVLVCVRHDCVVTVLAHDGDANDLWHRNHSL